MTSDESTGLPPGAEDLGNGVLRWTMQPVSPYPWGRALAWVAWGVLGLVFCLMPFCVGVPMFRMGLSESYYAVSHPMEDVDHAQMTQFLWTGALALLGGAVIAVALVYAAGYMLHCSRSHLELTAAELTFTDWRGRSRAVPLPAIQSVACSRGYSPLQAFPGEASMTVVATDRAPSLQARGILPGIDALCAEVAARAGLEDRGDTMWGHEYRRGKAETPEHGAAS